MGNVLTDWPYTCVSRTKHRFLTYQAGRCRNVPGALNIL